MGTEVHGIAMVKDEADVIRTTVEWMLSQVDQVHVADNESTDGTQQILNRLAESNDRLHISIDIEVGYYQSRKMTLLAEHAGRHGAAWVVPFDADEIWYSLYHERIADALDQCVDLAVVEADMYEHVPTPLATHGVMPGIAAMPVAYPQLPRVSPRLPVVPPCRSRSRREIMGLVTSSQPLRKGF